ncbi:hypothetical protein AB0N89_19820 [Amycolatopsis sp. NPDC089917]|uniref:hypothetical protein n=1 Tax=Amycolatopsis sp. NPDC089917 TaxID=3155187 RepID=UPI003431229C
MSSENNGRKAFGRPDPFCLFAVVPAFLAGILMSALGVWSLAGAGFAIAGLVLIFDSWVNRPVRRFPWRRRDGTGQVVL